MQFGSGVLYVFEAEPMHDYCSDPL